MVSGAALSPADVVVVRGTGLAAELIRLGAALAGKPNLSNHVAFMHHYDSGGVPWGLEGRPGGVGWVDMRPYIESRWTVNNCGQPGRDTASRAKACQLATSMLGTKYDWEAIGGDALADMHVRLWNPSFGNGRARPGEVVCSSFTAWLYKSLSWPRPEPGEERNVQPGDWDAFCINGGYSLPLAWP